MLIMISHHASVPQDLPEDSAESYNQPTLMAPAQRLRMAKSQPVADTDGELTELAGLAKAPEGSLRRAAEVSDRNFVLEYKIGEGGSGEVWAGQQSTLRRRVAVKRLKSGGTVGFESGPASDADRRWMEICFRQEALVAARLEHPNIVPVHDYGTDSSGTPMFAMKLVNGRPWNDIIQEEFSALEPEAFLSRHLPFLIALANAVDFAHSQGIIHRDLKPAQVMIGAYGEVQLMDWGLAMAFEPEGAVVSTVAFGEDLDSPLHNPVNPAGTPQFMAPEQTENHPGNLGPWTDVYLLGGILFLLLTGRGPHKAPSGTMAFKMAARGEILPLNLPGVKRPMPEALTNLAHQALNPDPAKRLPSARAFVQALEEYLSGAGKKRESSDLSKRVKERLAKARADYAELADLLNDVERALTLWPANTQARKVRQAVLERYVDVALSSRDLTLARVQAERLDRSERKASILQEVSRLEDEQRQADERLRAALAKSETMRARAEHILRFLIGDLFQNLEKLGRLDILEQASQEALAYFDNLTEEDRAATSAHDLVLALLNIAQVFNAQGRKAEALDVAQKALAQARAAMANDPQSYEAASDLAEALDRCGIILYYLGQIAPALEHHEEAHLYRVRCLERRPSEATALLGICQSRQRIAVCCWRNRDFERAERLFAQVLEGLSEVSGYGEPDDRTRTLSFWTYNWFANLRRDQDRLDDAIALTDQALIHGQALSASQTQNRIYRKDLLWCEQNRGGILRLAGRANEALKAFEHTLTFARNLCAEDPNNVEYLQPLSFSLSHVAMLRYQIGDYAGAMEATKETLENTNRLALLDPNSLMIQLSRIYPLKCSAEIHLLNGEWQAAEVDIRQGLSVAQGVLEKVPNHHIARWALATAHLLEAVLAHLQNAPRTQVIEATSRAKAALPTPPGLEGLNHVVLIAAFEGNAEQEKEAATTVLRRHQFTPLFQQVIETLVPGFLERQQ